MLAILTSVLWTDAVRAQDTKTKAAEGAATETTYRDMLCSYRDWDCDKAYRIMMCESTGNPYAEAGNNLGLMQLNTVHRDLVGGDTTRFYDPETNIRIAHYLYLSVGWTPWQYCSKE